MDESNVNQIVSMFTFIRVEICQNNTQIQKIDKLQIR